MPRPKIPKSDGNIGGFFIAIKDGNFEEAREIYESTDEGMRIKLLSATNDEGFRAFDIALGYSRTDIADWMWSIMPESEKQLVFFPTDGFGGFHVASAYGSTTSITWLQQHTTCQAEKDALLSVCKGYLTFHLAASLNIS